jgi:DNA adenine methylase
MKITNPVLRYYGSKFTLAQWIIKYFPANHRHYVEPFGGAANVLFVKEPSRLETYNDLNDKIVNFFRVLRDEPGELIRLLQLTPWSRSEYINCLEERENETPLESARRLFFRLWMSYSGEYRSSKGNFARHNKGRRPIHLKLKPENLYAASRRLLQVQIECRDALRLIEEMDSPDTLFYLDPPYVFSTRTKSNSYSHEMRDDDHRQFAELLQQLKGFVVLSGYPSSIYKEMFEDKGWIKIEKKARVMGGGFKTEGLWLNRAAARELKLLPRAVI